MDTGRIYRDSEGRECSIWEIVRIEPEWAAVRIQEGEKAISEAEQLRARIAELEAQNAELQKDRERLDWLTATIGSTEIAMEHIGSKYAIYIGASEPEGFCYEDYTLRQAIDASREGK